MRRRIAGLLLGCCAVTAMAQTTGEALFVQHCSVCHQVDGAGTVGLAPALKGPHWQALSRTPSYLPTVILKGLSGRIDVAGQVFIGSMPAFAAQLDDAQVVSLVAHVQGLQQVPSTQVSPQDVAKIRLEAGGPPQTRQWRQSLLQGR